MPLISSGGAQLMAMRVFSPSARHRRRSSTAIRPTSSETSASAQLGEPLAGSRRVRAGLARDAANGPALRAHTLAASTRRSVAGTRGQVDLRGCRGGAPRSAAASGGRSRRCVGRTEGAPARLCFAWYMATSARRSSSELARSVSVRTVMPIDASVVSSMPSISSGARIARSTDLGQFHQVDRCHR